RADVEITGADNDIDPLGADDVGDRREDRFFISQQVPPVERAPHVPVGGVQHAHADQPNGEADKTRPTWGGNHRQDTSPVRRRKKYFSLEKYGTFRAKCTLYEIVLLSAFEGIHPVLGHHPLRKRTSSKWDDLQGPRTNHRPSEDPDQAMYPSTTNQVSPTDQR